MVPVVAPAIEPSEPLPEAALFASMEACEARVLELRTAPISRAISDEPCGWFVVIVIEFNQVKAAVATATFE